MKKVGFTLIELLASMAILVILVMIVTNMITAASDTWNKGQVEVEQSDAAKNVMDLLWRDTSVAMINEYLPLWIEWNEYNQNAYLGVNSSLFFVANLLDRTGPGAEKDWKEVAYFVVTDARGRGALLRRAGDRTSVTNYTLGACSTEYKIQNVIDGFRSNLSVSEVMAENVYSFEVDPGNEYSFYSKSNAMPDYIYVKLKLLRNEDWLRTNWMTVVEFAGYAESNATEYSMGLSFILQDNTL